MKRFLINSIIFFVLIFALNLVVFFIGQKYYFRDYLVYSLNYKSYLFSDSHGYSLKGFTEKYGVYDFSEPSDSYCDFYRKIKFLIDNTHVDTIYIGVGDHTLSPYREDVNNMDKSIIYSMPEEFHNYYEYVKLKYVKLYFALLNPKIRLIIKKYLTTKMGFVLNTKKNVTENTNGQYTWASMTAEERMKNALNRSNTYFCYDHSSVKLEQTLLDIVGICQQNNIQVIGVKFPLSIELIDVLDHKSFNADKILQAKGLKVLDYTDVYVEHCDYFFDQDHLNDIGGKNFTKLLFADRH